MGDLKLGYNTGYWAKGPPAGVVEAIDAADSLGRRFDLDVPRRTARTA